MALEEQLLTASLTNTFHKAGGVLEQLYKLGPRSVAEAEGQSDEFEQADHFLSYYVEKAFRDVGILAERLGLPLLRKEIAEARYKIPDLTAVEILPDDFTCHSSPLQIARDYFDSLQPMTQGRDITGLGIFENILQNAGKITEQLGVEPTSEKHVRDCLRKALGFAFPDVVKEIAFRHSTAPVAPTFQDRRLQPARLVGAEMTMGYNCRNPFLRQAISREPLTGRRRRRHHVQRRFLDRICSIHAVSHHTRRI